MATSLPAPIAAAARHRDLQAFRALFARMPEALLIADDSRRYVEANQAACRLLHLSRREILRHRVGDFSGSATATQIDLLWRRFLAHGTMRTEWTMTPSAGSPRHIEFVARANFFPGLHLASVRDMQEHKRAETQQARLNQRLESQVAARTRQLEKLNQRLRAEVAREREIADALRQSERRYRTLFHRANDAIMIVDPLTLTVLAANIRAKALYGVGRQSMNGMSFAPFLADPVKEQRRDLEIMQGTARRTFEAHRFRRDGTPFTVSVNAVGVDYNGRRAILGIGRDVTAQQRAEQVLRTSEQRLRAALEASLDAVYMLEAVRNSRGRITDFRFTETNPRGLALVNARHRDLIGGLLCELMPINRTGGFFTKYVRVVESGEPLQETFQVAPPWKQAKWAGPKWLQLQVVRLGDGVLITARDVTQQKRTEEALRRLPHLLTQAQEAERRRVARELHDGVNQMLAAAHLVLRQPEGLMPHNPTLRNKLIARAAEIVRQTLTEVRRISQALRPSALDDLGLSAALSELLKDFAERTGLRLAWRPLRPAPAIPQPLAEALYRIAQEALANVEHHAHARSVTVRLATGRSRVTLTVEDDGCGFAPLPGGHAVGRGLLHLRERAEFAGGNLTVDSQPGRGTKISVSLPLPR